VLRLRELLVRKTHAVQAPIKSFLPQHGVDEPVGLARWSKKAAAALRGLVLLPELRFCLDLQVFARMGLGPQYGTSTSDAEGTPGTSCMSTSTRQAGPEVAPRYVRPWYVTGPTVWRTLASRSISPTNPMPTISSVTYIYH
jgi:hypothetical protein